MVNTRIIRKFVWLRTICMETIITNENKTVKVIVKGRLTTDETVGFLNEIEPLMSESRLDITMDLAELEFISSAGLRCFIMLLQSCKAKGSTLRLKNLTPQIKNVFSLTALLDKFEVE